MTQQLRLVEPPGTPGGATSGKRTPRATVRRARSGVARARGARRAASWGDWSLDSGTRRVGKAGVAAAREALEHAAARAHVVENHRQAS